MKKFISQQLARSIIVTNLISLFDMLKKGFLAPAVYEGEAAQIGYVDGLYYVQMV